MTHLPHLLVQQLDIGAYEMGEVYGSRGHSIDSALNLDSAFRRTRRSRSALTLDLLGTAFMSGMSQAGLSPHNGPGGSLEITERISGGYANVRLRRAEARGDEFFVRANKASSFGYVNEQLLEPDYPFVFGFTIDPADQVSFFVSEVTAVIAGSPGELVLGVPILLGGSTAPGPGKFMPDDDSWLPGIDDVDEQGEESA